MSLEAGARKCLLSLPLRWNVNRKSKKKARNSSLGVFGLARCSILKS